MNYHETNQEENERRRAKDQILEYVERTGEYPQRDDFERKDDCPEWTSDLFRELLAEGRIIEHRFDCSRFVDIQQAKDAMRKAGFRHYTVKWF